MVEQFTDRAVEPLDAAPVAGHVDTVGLRSIVLDELRRGIVRVVRQHGRIPDEERLARCTRAADEVVDRLHRVAADIEALVTVPFALRHPLRETAPRKIPLPPFSSLQTPVAMRREDARERRPLLEVPGHLLSSGCEGLLAAGWIVAHDSVLVWIPPRDDRGEARAAEAARDIASTVDEALAGEPVQARRAQVRMAHERIVAPVLIVGEDEHHVRWRSRVANWFRAGSPPSHEKGTDPQQRSHS